MHSVEGTVRYSAIVASLIIATGLSWAQTKESAGPPLPTGKSLVASPGRVGTLNSFPVTIAMSPDGRYAALLHAGFGTQQSRGCQSISVFDLSTRRLSDFPDQRLCDEAHQSYFVGLTFSRDGNHLYASLGSITDPTGAQPGDTGNAIAVYGFNQGKVTPERLIRLAPTQLPDGKWVAKGLFNTQRGTAIPYPAGLAVVQGKTERLLVANNFSDSAILIDAASGQILHQYDLSANTLVPSTYP
jgi:hypothetical protein